VACKDCLGYNAPRLGRMITLPYPGPPWQRHQMRGRLKRYQTQKRPSLVFKTVVPTGTMLELLHKRHNSHDAKMQTMQDIAAEFSQQASAPRPAAKPQQDLPKRKSVAGPSSAKRSKTDAVTKPPAPDSDDEL